MIQIILSKLCVNEKHQERLLIKSRLVNNRFVFLKRKNGEKDGKKFEGV